MPLTEDGTSTTALSVSNSMTGWPSETFVPGEIIKRTRSPWEMFSPSSGSLNSLDPEEGATVAAGAGGGGVGVVESAGVFCSTGAGEGVAAAAFADGFSGAL